MGTGAKQTGCEERLTETGCGASHPFGGGAPLCRFAAGKTFPAKPLRGPHASATMGSMETTPVTATTAANLDDKYADQLVHTTTNETAGCITRVAWSQEIKHRGRWYMHRTIERRDYDMGDPRRNEAQWFRIG